MIYVYNDNYLKFQHDGIDYAYFTLFGDESLKESDYGLMFFTSPYYRAEEDYFTVYLKSGSDKLQIGSLFPLQFLEEDDIDYVDEIIPHYKRFASLAIRKAINYLAAKKALRTDYADFRLTDFFKYPDVCLFVYSLHEAGSDISCIIPSFYDNGYYLLKDPLNEKSIELYSSSYMKSYVLNRTPRRSRNLFVKPIRNFELHKSFYTYLFTELLPYFKSPFYRFFSLYQAVELLSDHTYKKYEKVD